MNAFTSKGTLLIPVPRKVIKPNVLPTVVTDCFCPEGHNLVSTRFIFDGRYGILLKVRHGKNTGLISLSPILGQKNRVDSATWIVDNIHLVISCPICGIKLPVYSPCDCGADLITLYLDVDRSFGNCIGVCNRVGCKHAIVTTQNELSCISASTRW